MSFSNKIKHWFRDLWRYPLYRPVDASYDTYWSSRDMHTLNSFQRERVRIIAGRLVSGDSVLDVGCGDGRILEALSVAVSGITIAGIDSSREAIRIARERGLNVGQADIRNLEALNHDRVDWVLLLEVLEHMPESERILAWARAHARKGVIVSIPNTGFILHRLRLLFGRFPLQWRAHPGEHVRFWTLRDATWWLSSLGLSATITCYEGVPVLSALFPSLFAEGIIMCVDPD